jgi:hypothetical protein
MRRLRRRFHDFDLQQIAARLQGGSDVELVVGLSHHSDVNAIYWHGGQFLHFEKIEFQAPTG